MVHMFIVSTPMIPNLRLSSMHLVLPHLYHDENYVKIYRTLSMQGNLLLQDNSIFELKDVVAGDLIDYGKAISATYIMVPEVLRDSRQCIDKMEDFFAKLPSADKTAFKFAAAVQGKDYNEIKEHYRRLAYDERIDLIAIPFNFEFDAYGVRDEERKQAGYNRYSIIRRLSEDGAWRLAKDHHLLGLYNPAELSMYSTGRTKVGVMSSILSNDSSSCFWHSLYGVHYSIEDGLLYQKIESKVDFSVKYTSRLQYKLFERNAKIINGYLQGIGGESLERKYLRWIKEN